MSDDRAVFGLELLDKVSGPVEKITGGLEGASSALEKLHGSSTNASAGMTKVARATEYLTLGLRGLQVAHGVVDLVKAFGGMGAVKNGLMRAGQALKTFGNWAVTGLKKVAPFAAGGAGLYGLGKIATGIALPAMGATTAAIGTVAAAALGATVAVGYLGFKLAGLAFDGVKATASVAVFGQNSRMAFNALAKYGASGAKIFDHVRGLADEFGMSVQDTSDNYRDLLSSGFNPKQADQITKMGADMRFLGKSADQVKLAVIGISQIKATGNLQGDELNQVANAIGLDKAAVFDEIGKKIGKTRAEVMKLKEAGKLDQGVAIEGILSAVMAQAGHETELGQRGKEWANSAMEGFVGRIKAKGENLMIDLGDRLTPTLQRLAGAAFQWVDVFIKSGRAEKLVGKIGDTFDAVGDVLTKVTPLATKFLDGFGAEATKAFGALSDAVTSMNGADIDQTGAAFERMGTGLAQIVIYGGAAIGAIGSLLAMGSLATTAIGDLVDLPWRMGQIGGDMILGLARGIREGIYHVVDAVGEMGNAAVSKLRSVLDTHSPSRVFGAIGEYSAMGFALGISANAGMAADASHAMADGAVDASRSALLAPASQGQDMGTFSPSGLLGGSGISVRFGDIIVHADGSDPNEVATATRQAVRREIDEYFRDLDSES